MNIGRLLTDTALHYPGHDAVRWGGQRLSYRELDDRVNSLAAALTNLGLSTGDRIGFVMWNRPELLEVLFAAFKLGLCVVPLNARFNSAELVYHLDDPKAVAIVHGPEFRDDVEKALDRTPSVMHVISLDQARPAAAQAAVHDYEDLIAFHPDAPDAAVDVSPDHLCWLFYTSGTTGRPKGAMLTHGNLMFVMVGWVADLMPLKPEDVTLHAAPLTHGAGFHALAAIAKGSTNLIPEKAAFDTEATLELIEREGVTNTWLVPTQVNRLVQSPALADRDLSRLHSIVYGGAPFHVEDLKVAVERLGPVLVQVYGQGETPMTATYLRQEEHALGDPAVEARLASAGCSRTGMEVRLVDEDDNPVPAGELGEIVVRGPAVMSGYWERPDESARTLRGGWLHTGDIGKLDERGYLYVLDRLKDLIITGGANVYAREVEEVLIQHPEVAAVTVIGIPDRDWGERVVAVVVPAEGTEPEDGALIDYCGRHLASYKKPKQVHVVPSLPVSAYGKVLKRELREQFADA
ncbi:MAG: long-chain-fatty-acid--CoA ligase [Propionibacteriales bacterium]|nr:long-chain-fatty-acid--CoA ligase [Propionibacteriales bacterium]